MFYCVSFLVICAVLLAADAMSLPISVDDQPCGVEASSAPIHRNPWLVLLEYYRKGHKMDVRCGGTLVGKRHVITAAHCVKIRADMYKVRLGEYDLISKVDCEQEACSQAVDIDIIDVTIHPDYTRGPDHDVAVLTLRDDAPYTDFIRPICFPSSSAVNASFVASGWGEIPRIIEYSNVKKFIELPQWELTDCQDAYSHTVLPHDVICAGGEDGIDTCRGDSGGPLVQYKEKAELAGITSQGFSVCGTQGKPGIYTNFLTYVDWVRDIMDKV